MRDLSLRCIFQSAHDVASSFARNEGAISTPWDLRVSYSDVAIETFQTCCDSVSDRSRLKHNLQHFAFADSRTKSSKLIQSAAHRKKKALPQPSP